MQFLKFFTSQDTQLKLAVENSNAPTLKGVYTNATYLKSYPAAAEVAQALRSAEDRPGVAKWTNIEDELSKQLSAAINGSKTVAQALTDAEAAVNAILR